MVIIEGESNIDDVDVSISTEPDLSNDIMDDSNDSV